MIVRKGIISEFDTSSTVIGVPGSARQAARPGIARGFSAAHSRCTTETLANCSCVRP
jgi:hypothetical protein